MKILGVSVMTIVLVALAFYVGRHTKIASFIPVLG